ncbi:MAG: glycosyltransferase family 2 protein [Candidatus Pacearchaeota archaeon]
MKHIYNQLKELTIIIPVYNEERGIINTINEIKKGCPNAKILVVNDGSTDKTSIILKKIKNISVVNHKTNRGYGAALKTGIINAKTKYIAFIDADDTYPPIYIPVLLNKLIKHNLDCVWANRFVSGNSMPLIRKIGNKIIILFFLIITGKKVQDVSSGERVFKKDAFDKIDFMSIPNGLDTISALTKRIVSRGLKYKEVPIEYHKRVGNSKLKIFRDGYLMMKNILLEK